MSNLFDNAKTVIAGVVGWAAATAAAVTVSLTLLPNGEVGILLSIPLGFIAGILGPQAGLRVYDFIRERQK